MRLLLVDWMMEVCDEFGLSRETYHLASTYTDLYLTKIRCPIDKLQLLGASSLLLACKVEEIICPRVKDFVFATDNGFTNQQIIDMEAEIQKVGITFSSSYIGNGVSSLPCNIKLLVLVFHGEMGHICSGESIQLSNP